MVMRDVDWLAAQFDALTDEVTPLTPSEWAEEHRYLPSAVTPAPGPFRFERTPYIREILDCLGPQSPVREVAVMKGAQLAVTVGVLENYIGYSIDHLRTHAMMMVTADADMAKLRLEQYILPMVRASRLEDRIRSNDDQNKRKTGATAHKLEWYGGGSLLAYGARSPGKLRSSSIRAFLGDEVDGWPLDLGKEGDPTSIARKRTQAFESVRKILWLSTPLLEGTSHIARMYRAGDQRQLYVPCSQCNGMQVLRWRGSTEDGERFGIVWDMQDGRLVHGSVRYVCQFCGRAHENHEKDAMLLAHEWRPTATPTSPHLRSYHLPGIYSPSWMASWESQVEEWLQAWDVEREKVLNIRLLQTFYNTVLGEPFREFSERLTLDSISAVKRHVYERGQVPNVFAARWSGGPIAVLLCTVDVHGDRLRVGVIGWTPGRCAYFVDSYTWCGDPRNLHDEGTWQKLRHLIEQQRFRADDGALYPIALTFIDSGYLRDEVYRFCAEYEAGVFPVKGDQSISGKRATKEWKEMSSAVGTRGFIVDVDVYKDRWGHSLAYVWDESVGQQRPWTLNVPSDFSRKELAELTAEEKVAIKDKVSGESRGYKWHRGGSQTPNELWDLLVYSNAALEILAASVCKELGFEAVLWEEFFVAAAGRFRDE